jgi:hypothetical protein
MLSMLSVAEFCQTHRISRGTLYKLFGQGVGPTAVKIGRRTLISSEAAQEWRRRMEQEAPMQRREAERFHTVWMQGPRSPHFPVPR